MKSNCLTLLSGIWIIYPGSYDGDAPGKIAGPAGAEWDACEDGLAAAAAGAVSLPATRSSARNSEDSGINSIGMPAFWMRVVSSISNIAVETSWSLEISCNASPTIFGRMAAASEIQRGRTLRGTADNIDLIGTVLLNCRGNLTKTVHYFALDLANHLGIAEMHFADVTGAEHIAPLRRFG